MLKNKPLRIPGELSLTCILRVSSLLLMLVQLFVKMQDAFSSVHSEEEFIKNSDLLSGFTPVVPIHFCRHSSFYLQK